MRKALESARSSNTNIEESKREQLGAVDKFIVLAAANIFLSRDYE